MRRDRKLRRGCLSTQRRDHHGLIALGATRNPAEPIHFAISERTVARYLRRLRPRRGDPARRWLAFLANGALFDLFARRDARFDAAGLQRGGGNFARVWRCARESCDRDGADEFSRWVVYRTDVADFGPRPRHVL